jgi:integrase
MVEEVKSPENLTQRGATYYYRARVPDELRAHFGKREFSYSLKTKEFRVALERHARKHLEVVQLISEARRMGLAAPRTVDGAALSQDDCDRLASLWSADFLADDLRWYRAGGVSREMLDSMNVANDELENLLLEGLASVERGTFDGSSVKAQVSSTLDRYGITLDATSAAHARLSVAFMREGLRVTKVCRRRYNGYMGDDVPAPDALPLPALLGSRDSTAAAGGLSLDDLVAYWCKQETRRPRTLAEVQHGFKVLQVVHSGHVLDANCLTPQQVVAFKDKQLDAGKSPATVRKQLNLMGAVFSVALKNHKVARNPFAGVTVTMGPRTKKPRVPFTPDELKALFATPVFTEGHRPVGGAGEAAFWLPLLALFSGARMEELAQLLVADVKESEGQMYLHITDIPDEDDEGEQPHKSLKNASSRRRVPVHPELIRLGLLEYRQAMLDAGEKMLFPLVKTGSGDKRQRSANYSKWFGRYLREVANVSDKRKTFHSFRHGFKDAARRAGVPQDCHHALTGHSTGNAGDDSCVDRIKPGARGGKRG